MGSGTIGDEAFYDCTNLAKVTLGSGALGQYALDRCYNLAKVTLGSGVTSLGQEAFYDCTNLTGVYFLGNPPSADGTVFNFATNATGYYLAGATGWSSPFAGLLRMVLWNPLIQAGNADFGVKSNKFGFDITGPTNLPIVVEACTNLSSPVWTPVQTGTLTNGSFYFSEPFQTNGFDRFYRIGSP
jgi:hypothetical protein